MKRQIAVITGDIVGSTRWTGARRKLLDVTLAAGIKEVFNRRGERAEIYRGDSFQAETKPVTALRKALLLRLFLMKDEALQADARVSIGVGTQSYKAAKVTSSDGEAYRLSGRGIDGMEKARKMAVSTMKEDANKALFAIASLLDSIVSGYTDKQAEAVYYALQGKPQEEIAKMLGKTQPTVSASLKSAHFSAINDGIVYFESLFADKAK